MNRGKCPRFLKFQRTYVFHFFVHRTLDSAVYRHSIYREYPARATSTLLRGSRSRVSGLPLPSAELRVENCDLKAGCAKTRSGTRLQAARFAQIVDAPSIKGPHTALLAPDICNCSRRPRVCVARHAARMSIYIQR